MVNFRTNGMQKSGTTTISQMKLGQCRTEFGKMIEENEDSNIYTKTTLQNSKCFDESPGMVGG